MPKVRMKLLNMFRIDLGKKEVEYEGETMRDIISQFVEEHKDKIKPKLLDDGLLREENIILLNGRDIKYLDEYDTKVKEGDEIHLSIALGGG
ncbi:MAG: molybdopterin synthase sulfur carrier subunit [Candidatus Lokiarchaeota archaeon]|jgi:molybdopterin converting factor small subunit|nr:molybdopterin synthase sulfur carrier subunit [Candidatus Lokiarchaeota archaeon]